MSDFQIMATFGLPDRVIPGEKGLADKGYVGKSLKNYLTTPFKGKVCKEFELFNRAISAIRITIERVNGLIKAFGIMSIPFRNAYELHGTIFNVICQLINIRLEVRPLVKKIHRLLRGKSVEFDLESSRRRRGLF